MQNLHVSNLSMRVGNRKCGMATLLKSYPFSIFILAVVLFLSFFNPGETDLPSVDNLDKVVHMLMYCGLSSVFWFDWLRRRKLDRRAVVLGIVYCFVLPVVISGLIELGQQYLVTYRDGDWADFLANTIGCLLALPITFFFTVHLIEKLKTRKVYEKQVDM